VWFAVVDHKTVRSLGGATKLRPEASGRRRDPGTSRRFDVGGHGAGSRGLR
jgi:hypothetical protein